MGNKATGFYDQNEREIWTGDLIKVFHFRAYNRRRCWLYFIIIERDERFYGVSVSEISEKWQEAHKFLLDQRHASQSEVISGSTPCETASCGILDFWERPKRKKLLTHGETK